MRAEIGALLDGRDLMEEPQALHDILPRASGELAVRVRATLAYERFAYLLETAFRELCRVSTLQGSQPVTAASAAGNEIIDKVAHELPDRYKRAAELMASLDLELPFEQQLGHFGERLVATDLVATVMAHHERHQQSKPPRGKRPWFEEYGRGWVVRQPYRDGTTVAIASDDVFIHPFRISTMQRFLGDLAG
jgi:hypothetical protein